MDFFRTKNNAAYCEEVPLADIATAVGTPVYVYSLATLRRHCDQFQKAFANLPVQACFAVKANSNIALLKEIAQCGFGADIVSIGELERALLADIKPSKIVFSGVGKREDEISRALEVGILSFDVESEFELVQLSRLAKILGRVAPICLRVNPNIDAKTNKKISTGLHATKFGLTEDQCHKLLTQYKDDVSLKFLGLACHIGSQITHLAPLQLAVRRLLKLAVHMQDLYGLKFEWLNMGGGLGIRYHRETPPTLKQYASVLRRELKASKFKILLEPGRVLVGNCGILLTQVLGTKTNAKAKKNFAIIDASMSELLRPALYDAYHEILPARLANTKSAKKLYDVVGPVCETTDILGSARMLPSLQSGDLLYIRTAGAYGATMASNYNTRVKPAEVLVDGTNFKVIRKAERLADLWRHEVF